MQFDSNTYAALFSAGEEMPEAGVRGQPAAAAQRPLLTPLLAPASPAHAGAQIMQALRAGRLLRPRSGRGALQAPATRLTCPPAYLAVPRHINRLLRQSRMDFTLDADFAAVWAARPSLTGLRLLPLGGLRSTLEALQASGQGHHFMLRDQRQRWLASGYGIEVGKAFCIVFMRGRTGDAARCALILLARHLAHWGYSTLEASAAAALTHGLGFAETSPGAYQEHCGRQDPARAPVPWRALPDICTSAPKAWLHLPTPPEATDADPHPTTREALLGALQIVPAAEARSDAAPTQPIALSRAA